MRSLGGDEPGGLEPAQEKGITDLGDFAAKGNARKVLDSGALCHVFLADRPARLSVQEWAKVIHGSRHCPSLPRR